MPWKYKQTIVVVGAGAAGISAALELAERGYQVELVEQDTICSGSSGRNPGRMGHGFHYDDVETAKMYLRASIEVQRKYPNYLVGKELPFDHPLRHGRYFITVNSDSPPEKVLETYKKIKQEYIRLIEEDPQNEVFGPPENFYRILDPNEYQGQVNPEIVSIGVETAEHLFDWQAFTKDIKKTILANKNITLREHTEVTGIERGELNQERFVVRLKNKDDSSTTLRTDFVVNSTWQNIEKFNAHIGHPMVPGARTNRLKSLLVVKLPESLVDANSMFFCMGQHCMFSNLGNGYGMITYANITNMETSTGINLSERANRLLAGGATDEEKESISRAMLDGVAKYIPDMAKAIPVELKFGIVQTAGVLTLEDLKNPNSAFHKRDYDGIEEKQIGFIANPCIKLFYYVRNGKIVADIVDAQVNVSDLIDQHMKEIAIQAPKSKLFLNTDLLKALTEHMERHATATTATVDSMQSMRTAMFQTMLHKKAVLAEIKRRTTTNIQENKEATITPSFFMQIMCSKSTKVLAAILLIAGVTALAIGTLGATAAALLGAASVVGVALCANSFFAQKNNATLPCLKNSSSSPLARNKEEKHDLHQSMGLTT